MTWSLALVDGDLAKSSGNQLAIVTDQQKVIQDLACWFYHPYGIDPMTPSYGSFLDSSGGFSVQIDNQSIVLPTDYTALIQEEIARILNAYVQNQGIKYKLQSQLYNGNPRIGFNELINNFTFDTTQAGQTLFVNISLGFVSGGTADIQLPIQNNTPG